MNHSSLTLRVPGWRLAGIGLLALLAVTSSIEAAATRSTPIAISAANVLVGVNPDANTVSIFDAAPATPVKLAEVPVGQNPSSVAITPNGQTAFVANAGAGTVSIVDLVSRQLAGSISVGAEPMALALSPMALASSVANSAANSLSVCSTVTRTVVATVDLSSFGTAPRAIAVTDDGDGDDTDETIFVALFYAQLRPGKTSTEEGQDDQREGHVVAISAATYTLLGSPNPILLNPLANTGFNGNGQLAPGNGLTPAVPQTNPQTFTTPAGAFPNQLASLALHPTDPTRAYVVGTGASPNGPFRFSLNVQGLVSVINTVTRTEITAGQTDPVARRTAPLNLNQGVNLATFPAPRLFHSNPTAIAWRPNGSDAWIAIQQADTLVRMTIDAGGIPTISAPLVAGPSTIVRVDLQEGSIPGKAPRGVVIDAAGTRAYVLNYVSRSISVVDISNPTAPTNAASVLSTALPTPNTPDAMAQLGAEMFYSGRGPNSGLSSEAWGSCVACHPHGRTDNVTWMFDSGPRQTIALDGTFGPIPQRYQPRILNWSAVRDEVHDFELNLRNVSGGRGLIDDDRLFLALGGANGATPTDANLVEQFHQFTGAIGTVNDLTAQSLPALPSARRDFAIATLPDGRVFIFGGRSGPGQGTLVSGTDTVLEFNPRLNTFQSRSALGFTRRHSFGAAAVRTSGGVRLYAIGGYVSTSVTASPVGTVEEYNPATDTWRTVATLSTAVAQFGIAVAGGINTAEPLQLIHVVAGNTGTESAPSVANPSPVQRFQADPAGAGTWSGFNPTGLTLRHNHGVAAVLRGVVTRLFIIGGQDAAGTVLDTVQEYSNATVPAAVFTPHTSLPAPRARFGIASTLSSQQIYVFGGVDGAGTDQATVFEFTVANNGPVAGPPGTPSGNWVNRGNLSVARSGLQVSTPPGVVNLLPVASNGRSAAQDALAEFVRLRIRPAKAPVPPTDPDATAGRTLFGTVGLVTPGFSCASCHSGPNWTHSFADYLMPPSPDNGIGLGNERVIGAELRGTATQPNSAGPIAAPQAPGVLLNVGTFAPNSAGGRVNEIRFNAADVSQAVAPLGASGFNIPSLLSVHESGPYFYSGLAQTLDEVLDGSKDGNGGTRHHFVASASQRAQLIAFLRSIDESTPIFPGPVGGTISVTCSSNITVECTGGLTPVTFSVSANVAVPVSCMPPSGTGFRLGTSNVVCTAGGATSPCQFTVTVQDTTPPTVTCSPNLVVDATNMAGAVVTYIAGAFDACGIASFECAPGSGSTFPFGVTPVACTAVDTAGNTNACTFTVTVGGCAPSITVTSTNDSGPGTLRQAIAEVCPGGRIDFNAALNGQAIVLTSGELVINKSLSIVGPGANQLAVSGNKASRVFNITASGLVVNLSGLRILDGHDANGYGGGISQVFVDATLNLSGCTITNCSSVVGGGLAVSSGTLSIVNSSIVGNRAENQSGGLDLFECTASISNSTISANLDGAIANYSILAPSTLTLAHCTVTGNQGSLAGIVTIANSNGMATTRLLNTLVAGNTAEGANRNFFTQAFGPTIANLVSFGHNLDSDGSSGLTNGVNGDQIGTQASPINPLLGPLANNGGPTPTHALLPGSPAINTGSNALAAGLLFDQRGSNFARLVGPAVDIGAFEVQDNGPACLVNWKFDEASGLVALDSSGNTNLGRLLNGPIRTNGVLGRALRFDGSNDRVQATNASSLNVTGAFTIACWVRPEIVSDYRYFFIKGNDEDERFAYALRSANAKVEYRWVNPAGIQSAFRTTTNVLAIGRWTHVAVAHAPGSAPTIFINGVAVPSSLLSDGGSASFLIGTSPNPFCVGMSADGVDRFKGTIDEIFVCLTKLTAGQIRNLTNGLPPGPPPPPPAVGIATVSPLPGGAVGATYSTTLMATGGTPGFTWSLVSGTLPGGLTLNTNTGVIAGTPTAAGTNTFRIRVRDTAAQLSEKDFALAIASRPPCLVHWKFDETNGTSALDSSGNGITGTLLNGPVRTNGQVNRALRFDGSNDRVNGGNPSLLNHTGALTLAAWVRPESVSGTRVVLIKGELDEDDFAWALALADGRLQYRWVNTSGNDSIYQSAPVVLASGRWTHIAAVHTPGGAPRLYTNGVLVAGSITAGSGSANIGVTSRAFTVGSSSDGADRFLGIIDEVFVCRSALDTASLNNLMAGLPPDFVPAPPVVPSPGDPTLVPIACAVRVVDGMATISWPSIPGFSYRVQYKDSLDAPDWQDLSGEVFVPGEAAASVEDIIDGHPQRFYRVVPQP